MKEKILSLILAITFLVSGSNLMLVTSFAEESVSTNTSGLPEINVWLIAGQSNGEGYGIWENYPTDSLYASDKAFLEAGAENVLYMGRTDTSFTNVKPKATRTGAEIGIATSYIGRNEMNAVIKVALGNTYLYNDTYYDNSKNYGTWTPPTYIKNHNIDTSDNKVGELYNAFIEKIYYGLSELINLGYAPKIKGIWYMQGEAETLNSGTIGQKGADAYEELLTTLISDLRSDITKVTGADYSTLPFLYGRIYRNPGTDPSTGALYSAATPYLSNIQAAQDAVAAKNITNVRMINTTTDLVDPVTGEFLTPVQQDGWHYDSLTQQAIGEKIVATVESMNYTSPTVTNPILERMIVSATVTKYPDYKNGQTTITTSSIDVGMWSDGNTSTGVGIDYVSAGNVSTYSLNADDNKNQHWFITLDKSYKLDSLTVVYNYTNKWVDFNIQVSEDNISWTDLGTIRPAVASANGDPVTIPLSASTCKYIKLSVVKRNATTVDDETVAWGANLGAGCTVTLYELSVNEASEEEEEDNSIVTPYGTIPSEYADVDAHPWVWFDESGNFKGSATNLYGSNSDTSIVGQAKVYMAGNAYDATTQSYGDNEKAGFILLRKDYTMGSSERYGNMSQIQGTVTIDLNGFKVTTHSGWQLVYSQIKPWAVTGEESLFPTELKFINGSVVVNAKGLGNFETWTSSTSTVTDLTQKTFTHTYEDITFTLASGVTLSSLFTVTDNTHDANGYVNFIDCKFDFKTSAPSSAITLFNALGSKIKMNYSITGSEIYADSMANITLSNIADGSSMTFEKDSDGLYLKVYVTEENKATFTEGAMNTAEGSKEFVECAKTGDYALYILGYEEQPINENGTLNYFDQVFASVDSFTLANGTIYQGPVGVIFATTLEKVGDYKRTEYGVIISDKELTIEEFKTDKNAVWAKGSKINSANQYGIRFYGTKIKTGNTCYTLPYSKYINSMGTEVIIYGTKVLEFTPASN